MDAIHLVTDDISASQHCRQQYSLITLDNCTKQSANYKPFIVNVNLIQAFILFVHVKWDPHVKADTHITVLRMGYQNLNLNPDGPATNSDCYFTIMSNKYHYINWYFEVYSSVALRNNAV